MEKVRSLLLTIWRFFDAVVLNSFINLIAWYFCTLATVLVAASIYFKWFPEHGSFSLDANIAMMILLTYGGWVWGFLFGAKSYKQVFMGAAIPWLFSHALVPFSATEWAIIPGIALGVFCRKKSPEKLSGFLTKQFKMSWGFKVFLLILTLVLFTFTLPYSHKGCISERSQNTAIAKEAASMISSSYSAYTLKKKASSKSGPQDLIQHMNYVTIDTSSDYSKKQAEPEQMQIHTSSGWLPFVVDWAVILIHRPAEKQDIQGTPLQPCSQRLQCLKLHNGGILQFDAQQHFGGAASTNAIFFNLDPDGYGPQGRSSFYQYYNGRLTTGEQKLPGAKTSPTTLTPQDKDPKYLTNWD